jgi:hypothetical protein
MGDGLSQDDLDALFGDIQSEKKTPKEIKISDSLSQEDLDNLFGDIQFETEKPAETKNADGLSQGDLDNLFGDIQLETKKPKEPIETKNVETLEGGETLTQDQIDELLKAMLDN